jgi:predicted Zn-dependent protease
LRLLSDTELPPLRLLPLLAQVGETDEMERLIARVAATQPEGTLFNGVWLPLARSIQALAANQPDAAVEALRPAERFEPRWGDLRLQRALAHVQRGDHAAATVELSRLIEREPPMAPAASTYPFALVTLARARAAAGDARGARQVYERFLELWKDADRNLALLAAARKEHAALR